MLKYAVQEWETEIRGGAVQLTPIVPIVFYHGVERWQVAHEFSALFMWEGRELLRSYVPEFRYYLCDLSAIPDDEIKGGWRLRAILTTLKHIFDRHAGSLWPRLIAIFKNAPERVGVSTLATLLRYIVGVREVTVAELGQLIDATYPQAKEETMTTLTQSWKQQGIQQGIQQGRQQARVETLQAVLLRQLQHRFGALDEAIRTRLLKLPVEALDALSEAWLDFVAIDDLIGWLDQHESARQ